MNVSHSHRVWGRSPFPPPARLALACLALLLSFAAGGEPAGPPDPEAKYLIYLHGKIIETQGVLPPVSERHGAYEFAEIVAAWQRQGFTVIAAQASALLVNPRLNFALLASGYEAACAEMAAAGEHLWGNVLSVYDPADETGAGSCACFFDAARGRGLRRTREVQVPLGLGHGILFRPHPEVIDAVTAWADELVAEEDIRPMRLGERALVLMRGPWRDTMTVLDAGPSLVVVDAWSTPQAARRGQDARRRLGGFRPARGPLPPSGTRPAALLAGAGAPRSAPPAVRP